VGVPTPHTYPYDVFLDRQRRIVLLLSGSEVGDRVRASNFSEEGEMVVVWW